MASSKKAARTESAQPTDGNENLLNAFLSAMEEFVSRISSSSADAAAKGEQLTLIQSTGESLVGQTTKLTAFVRESADRLSPVQRMELDKFLSVQDGVAIANRGIAGTQQLLARGIVGNLVHWISQHIKELKKILSEILHLVFDLLHIHYPDWLDRILQIIDQVLDLLLSLLGEVFGIDFGRTARQLSDQEVNFLHEWAAFESIRAVRSGMKTRTSEDTN